MDPRILLPILVGGALGAAGILQGLQWKAVAAESAGDPADPRLRSLESELELLRRENQSLRALAGGGGELEIPAPLIELVEEAIGLEFSKLPVIHQTSSDALRERVTAAIESRFPPNSLDHRQQAWTLMGLLTADDRFAAQLAATRSIGARSWFDETSGDAWVTDRFDPQAVPDQSALVRALARILLHQHFPPPSEYPGDDPERAREALFHGTAMAVENRFLARQAVRLGFTGVQQKSDALDLLGSLPTFIRGLATFPSLHGTPFAERRIDRQDFHSALEHPPLVTAAYFDGPPIDEISNPEIPIPPLRQAVLEESAGMLGLRLWLETLDPELAPLARSWRGDRYRLVARDDVTLDLWWEIRFDQSASADRFIESALAMAGSLADAEIDPAPGESVTTPDGRRLTVSKVAAHTVRFLNSAPE